VGRGQVGGGGGGGWRKVFSRFVYDLVFVGVLFHVVDRLTTLAIADGIADYVVARAGLVKKGQCSRL
jgi:hypothetical protein